MGSWCSAGVIVGGCDVRVIADVARSVPERTEVWAGVAAGLKILVVLWVTSLTAGATGSLLAALSVGAVWSAAMACASREPYTCRVHGNSQMDDQ